MMFPASCPICYATLQPYFVTEHQLWHERLEERLLEPPK